MELRHLTLKGFVGWLFWGVAHIYFLIGLRNRIAIAFNWAWDYVTFARGARLITEPANAEAGSRAPRNPSGQPSAVPPATNAGASPQRAQIWG